MLEETLLLEIGQEAFDNLSDDEVSAILGKYSETDIKLAGMKAFDVLRKKYQPNYRMGKMYENLSDLYIAYDRIYKEYASSVGAGRLGTSEFPTPMNSRKFT